jgi:hypothetical protein
MLISNEIHIGEMIIYEYSLKGWNKSGLLNK